MRGYNSIVKKVQNFTQLRPAVFFDRDGTLNEDRGYPHKSEDLALIPGAAKAVRNFNEQGYLTVIVTNQSGIARNYFGTEDLKRFNAALRHDLLLERAKIDLILYCPHHPDFSGPCACRKPLPGMIHSATQLLPINLSTSFLIGDRTSDLLCATASGIKGYLFEGGNLYEFCRKQSLFEL
jgi:D-glycero-D-manno-heptose 1,7-bisphosphate phosphatase